MIYQSKSVSPFYVTDSIKEFNKSGAKVMNFYYDDIETYYSHVRWLRVYEKSIWGTWDGDNVEMRISYVR